MENKNIGTFPQLPAQDRDGRCRDRAPPLHATRDAGILKRQSTPSTVDVDRTLDEVTSIKSPNHRPSEPTAMWTFEKHFKRGWKKRSTKFPYMRSSRSKVHHMLISARHVITSCVICSFTEFSRAIDSSQRKLTRDVDFWGLPELRYLADIEACSSWHTQCFSSYVCNFPYSNICIR